MLPKMIRRPKATDTEEDLLSLQESFLASKELPSASLHTQGGPVVSRRRVQVGEKRSGDHAGGLEEEEWSDQARDVVQLHPQGECDVKCATEIHEIATLQWNDRTCMHVHAHHD